MDSEPGRCRRTDGKKWRCKKEVVLDQKYCERHMNRGRARGSRKPVECFEIDNGSSRAPETGLSDPKRDSAKLLDKKVAACAPITVKVKIPSSNTTTSTVNKDTPNNLTTQNGNKRKIIASEEDGIFIDMGRCKGDNGKVSSKTSSKLGFSPGKVLQAGT